MNFIFKILASVTFALLMSCGSDTPPSSVHYSENDRSWIGTARIVNKNTYKEFLRDNRICDLGDILNVGWAKCSKWDNNPDLKLSLDKLALPSDGQVHIVAYADRWGANSSFQTIILNAGSSNPFKYWNENRGFATLTQGNKNTYSWSAQVRIKAFGDPSDQSLDLEIDYRGARMLEATLEKGFLRKPQSVKNQPLWKRFVSFVQSLF